ncbi:MAG: hypothetical protein IT424_11760 [Pirellulales bacterium]|nr:hypothetical protein [Pirellulales bacterium]
MTELQQFVADGEERYYDAAAAEIRAAIEAEYAARLAAASRLGRWRLRREIEREVNHRLQAAVSALALY